MQQRRRKRTDTRIVVTRKKPEEVPSVDEVPEEAAPKPKTTRGPVRPTRRVGSETKTVEKSKRDYRKTKDLPRKFTQILDDSFWMDLLDIMREGEPITLIRMKNNRWKMILEPGITITKEYTLKGKAYWNEVLTPEYQQFQEEWEALDGDEKILKAEEAGVKWEEHNTPRINVMRATGAYRESLKIQKYKDEYDTILKRKRVRGN